MGSKQIAMRLLPLAFGFMAGANIGWLAGRVSMQDRVERCSQQRDALVAKLNDSSGTMEAQTAALNESTAMLVRTTRNLDSCLDAREGLLHGR